VACDIKNDVIWTFVFTTSKQKENIVANVVLASSAGWAGSHFNGWTCAVITFLL